MQVQAVPGFLKNLTSLAINKVHSESEWRYLLETPSRTLRHLRLDLSDEGEEQDFEEEQDYENEKSQIQSLNFPDLEFLELQQNPQRYFPRWTIVPSSLTLNIEQCDIMKGLPSVSEIWVQDMESWERLAERCPILKGLRITSEEFTYSDDGGFDNLVNLLRKRKENVEAGKEVDGVEMMPIKTLKAYFKGCTILSELRELVEEVIELE